MGEAKLGKPIEGDAGRDAIHVCILPLVLGERMWTGNVFWISSTGEAVGGWHADATGDPLGIIDPFLPPEQGYDRGERVWGVLFPGSVVGMRHVWVHPAIDRRVDEYTQTIGEPRMQKVIQAIQAVGAVVSTEDAFKKALEKDAYDNTTRLVYADWLEENGRELEARRLREWTPQAQQMEDKKAEARAWLEKYAAAAGRTFDQVLMAANQYLDNRVMQFNDFDHPDIFAETEQFWTYFTLVTGRDVPDEVRGQHFFRCAC